MNDLATVDLGFVGTKYTWENRQPMIIKERLDKAITNLPWIQMFAGAEVQHLNMERFDHVSIILKLRGDQSNKG